MVFSSAEDVIAILKQSKQIEPLTTIGKCIDRIQSNWQDTRHQIQVRIFSDPAPYVVRYLRGHLFLMFSEGAIAQYTEEKIKEEYEQSLMILVNSKKRRAFIQYQKAQLKLVQARRFKGKKDTFFYIFLSFWLSPFELKWQKIIDHYHENLPGSGSL
jgi:hypothetical protein